MNSLALSYYLHSPLSSLPLHGIKVVPSILCYSSQQHNEEVSIQTKSKYNTIILITVTTLSIHKF